MWLCFPVVSTLIKSPSLRSKRVSTELSRLSDACVTRGRGTYVTFPFGMIILRETKQTQLINKLYDYLHILFGTINEFLVQLIHGE